MYKLSKVESNANRRFQWLVILGIAFASAFIVPRFVLIPTKENGVIIFYTIRRDNIPNLRISYDIMYL